MESRGLRVIQNAYFSLLKHIKELTIVTLCNTPAGIEVSFGQTEDGRTGGRTDRSTDRRGNLYSDSR